MKRFTYTLAAVAAVLIGAAMVAGLPIDFAALSVPLVALANAPLVLPAEELKKLEDAISKKAGEVVEAAQKALRDEVAKFNTITGDTNEKIKGLHDDAKKNADALNELKQRQLDFEQKLSQRPGGGGGADESRSPGLKFVESAEYKSADAARCREIPAVEIGAVYQKTALINATGQNQPLVPDQRVPGIITPANRRLTIRDLLPQFRTSSNLVQFATESTYTNNAGPQFNSPSDRENVTKNESAFAFTLSNSAVATIAHWLPVSRQLLADAAGLQSYIDGRLLYGLKLEEEEQILTGDGTGGNLTGLVTGDTAYNRGVSNDSMLDCLLKAILQVALSEYTASGIVLNPIDWTTIQLLKDTQGRYLFADPQAMSTPRLWGLPVVSTNTMTSGTFQTGAYDLAAAIWDREDATVRVAEQHDDFFVKNMVAILCEERMALTIYRATAIVGGSLPALGT